MSVRKGVTYDSSGKLVSCLFCNIIKGTEPATIVFKDSNFCVFKTIAPANDVHLLVTPVNHVKNLTELHGREGADMVREMVKIGGAAMGSDFASTAQYCFHVPPYNQIDHLHLHCISTPSTMSFFHYLKYMPNSFWCETAESVIKRLEKN